MRFDLFHTTPPAPPRIRTPPAHNEPMTDDKQQFTRKTQFVIGMFYKILDRTMRLLSYNLRSTMFTNYNNLVYAKKPCLKITLYKYYEHKIQYP